MSNEGVHLAHCNQGEYQGSCKYDEDDTCPALWDPWNALGVHLGGYNSLVDLQGLEVLRGIRDKLFCNDIAARTGLSKEHVELWQYIFCSAKWCEYGTSPRGCWADCSIDINEKIRKWETYYRLTWSEEPVS